MSDTMLLGVLRMPHELAMADDLLRSQCWSRAAEAADRIEADAERIAALQSRLARYEQPDDEQSVTEEFGDTIFGDRVEHQYPTWRVSVGPRIYFVTFHQERFAFGALINGTHLIANPRTRGQVRRLIQALKGEP